MNTNILIKEDNLLDGWVKPYPDLQLFFKYSKNNKGVHIKLITGDILENGLIYRVLVNYASRTLINSDILTFSILKNDMNWKIPYIIYQYYNDYTNQLDKMLHYAKLSIDNNINLAPGNFTTNIQKEINLYTNKPVFKIKRFLKRLVLFINRDNMSLKNLLNFNDVNYLKTNDLFYTSWLVKDVTAFDKYGNSYITKNSYEIELV